jgi:plastocyanin
VPSAGAGGTSTSASPGGSAQGPAPEPGTPPGSPPSLPHVQVTAVEYSFTLSRTTVPAGKIMLELVNHGQDEHNLNLLSGEGALASSFANTPANGIRDQEVEVQPGSYTLFCSLPEHEQKGMKATLLVE